MYVWIVLEIVQSDFWTSHVVETDSNSTQLNEIGIHISQSQQHPPTTLATFSEFLIYSFKTKEVFSFILHLTFF